MNQAARPAGRRDPRARQGRSGPGWQLGARFGASKPGVSRSQPPGIKDPGVKRQGETPRVLALPQIWRRAAVPSARRSEAPRASPHPKWHLDDPRGGRGPVLGADGDGDEDGAPRFLPRRFGAGPARDRLVRGRRVSGSGGSSGLVGAPEAEVGDRAAGRVEPGRASPGLARSAPCVRSRGRRRKSKLGAPWARALQARGRRGGGPRLGRGEARPGEEGGGGAREEGGALGKVGGVGEGREVPKRGGRGRSAWRGCGVLERGEERREGC